MNLYKASWGRWTIQLNFELAFAMSVTRVVLDSVRIIVVFDWNGVVGQVVPGDAVLLQSGSSYDDNV